MYKDFCKIERGSEKVKKGFKEKEMDLIRFTPEFSFGKSNPPAFELSSEDEGQINQWWELLNAKMDGWQKFT